MMVSKVDRGTWRMPKDDTTGEVFTLVDKTAQGIRQCENHPDALMRIAPGSVRGKVSPSGGAAFFQGICLASF